jgi:hypothetical protein
MTALAHPSAPRFPVVFRLPGGKPVAGSLTVTTHALVLVGGAADAREHREVAFDELREVRIIRGSHERLNGLVALALELGDEPPVFVAPIGQGLLHEVADLLAGVIPQSAAIGERVAVAVSLAPGTDDDVRALVAKGPPVEPAELGLRAHEVWLDERRHEVVFVFEGDDARRKVERAARSPALWRAGLAWRRCIAGRPKLVLGTRPPSGAELLYSWRSAD